MKGDKKIQRKGGIFKTLAVNGSQCKAAVKFLAAAVLLKNYQFYTTQNLFSLML